MVNGTKIMSGVNRESLIKYANTPELFSVAPGKYLLKAKSITPEVDAYVKGVSNSIKVDGALEKLSPKLAKKPPLWKLVIGKIFGQ